jgi:hypothetical protein
LIFSGGSFVPFCGISEVNFYAKSENGMIEKYMVLRDVFNEMSICHGSRTWYYAFIHPLQGSKGDVELARKEPWSLDQAVLAAVAFFDSMVLGKLFVP